MVGVLEPRAGVLFPERCIAAHLDLARTAGAELRFDEPVQRWEAHGNGIRVFTERGEYVAANLIVSAGAWVGSLFPELALPFAVERQVLYWFEAKGAGDVFDATRCPIHLWQFDGRQFFYGFPDLGTGIKVARHHRGRETSVEGAEREVAKDEIDDIRRLVRRFVPRADSPLRESAVCLYTNTPDEHFWIDRHPAHPQVLIVSPCSGHGFKFASVIGEIVADSVIEGRTRFDLSLFRTRPAWRRSRRRARSFVAPAGHDAGRHREHRIACDVARHRREGVQASGGCRESVRAKLHGRGSGRCAGEQDVRLAAHRRLVAGGAHGEAPRAGERIALRSASPPSTSVRAVGQRRQWDGIPVTAGSVLSSFTVNDCGASALPALSVAA